MSNTVYITPTKFVDARTGAIDLGYRAHDSYASTYHAGFESIPDDDLEFFKMVIEMGVDEVLDDMINFCAEHDKPIVVGGTLFEWAQLEGIVYGEEEST